jgi:hypothetical protein
MNSEKSPLFGGFFIEAPTEENSILLVERKIGSTILIVRNCVLTFFLRSLPPLNEWNRR